MKISLCLWTSSVLKKFLYHLIYLLSEASSTLYRINLKTQLQIRKRSKSLRLRMIVLRRYNLALCMRSPTDSMRKWRQHIQKAKNRKVFVHTNKKKFRFQIAVDTSGCSVNGRPNRNKIAFSNLSGLAGVDEA